MGLPPRGHKKTRQPSPPCSSSCEEEQVASFFHDSSSTRRSTFLTNYNGIEHQRHHHHRQPHQQQQQHQQHHGRNSFQKALYEKGLEEVEQEGDGNCLFRAVGLQVYGDSDSHMEVRRRCMDFMAKEQAHFAQFVPTNEPFQSYIERKRKDGVHGNNPEIQAISELYNRPVQVYMPSHGATPINIFQSEYKTSDIPIRLAYHDGNHYNAIVDPFLPTAGLGLGLPGLEPGLADKLQMQRAKQESDRIFINQIARQTHDMELKRAMEESSKLSSMDYWMRKKRALEYSDLEEADFELEQMALLSSLETCPKTLLVSRESTGALGATSATTSAISEEEGQKMSGLHWNQPSEGGNEYFQTSTNTVASATATSSGCADVVTTTCSTNNEDKIHVQQALEKRLKSHHENDGITTTNHEGRQVQDDEEYPRIVQELVMNGFELSKVLKAYELIGDNFDDLVCYLMSSSI